MPDGKIAEAYVEIGAHTSSFHGKMGKLHNSLKQLASKFSGIARKAKWAFAGISGALSFTVLEFSKAQLASDGLSTALDVQSQSLNAAAVAAGKLGMSSGQLAIKNKQAYDAIRKYDSGLQNTSTFSRRAIEDFQSQALASGASVSSLGTLTKATIGLAQVTGGNLASAYHMIQEAQSGNMGMLTRILPKLKTYKTVQEKMAYVMKTSAGGFKINQAAAKTFGGSMIRLKNQVSTLAASFGKVLLPYLKMFLKYMNELVNWFQKLSPAGKKWVVISVAIAAAVAGLIASLPILIGIIGAVSSVIGIVTTVTTAFGVALEFLAANPIGAIIAAIGLLIVGIVEMIEHWHAVVRAAVWVGSKISAIFRYSFNFVGDLMEGAVTKLKNGFAKVMQWASNVWAWIKAKAREAVGLTSHAKEDYAKNKATFQKTERANIQQESSTDAEMANMFGIKNSTPPPASHKKKPAGKSKLSTQLDHDLKEYSAPPKPPKLPKPKKIHIPKPKKIHIPKLPHVKIPKLPHIKNLPVHHVKTMHTHTSIGKMSLAAAFEKNTIASLVGQKSVPQQQLTEAKKQTTIMAGTLKVNKKIMVNCMNLGALA